MDFAHQYSSYELKLWITDQGQKHFRVYTISEFTGLKINFRWIKGLIFKKLMEEVMVLSVLKRESFLNKL